MRDVTKTHHHRLTKGFHTRRTAAAHYKLDAQHEHTHTHSQYREKSGEVKKRNFEFFWMVPGERTNSSCWILYILSHVISYNVKDCFIELQPVLQLSLGKTLGFILRTLIFGILKWPDSKCPCVFRKEHHTAYRAHKLQAQQAVTPQQLPKYFFFLLFCWSTKWLINLIVSAAVWSHFPFLPSQKDFSLVCFGRPRHSARLNL